MMFNRFGFAITLATIMAFGLAAGCGRDVRLAGRKLREANVRTVEHYGITLDQSATPKQVAFVLLRAIRDDFLARTDAEREAALDIQFDVCAANEIQARSYTGLTPAETIYNVVYRWTPTVAHYVHDFDMDSEQAQKRLILLKPRPAAQGAAEERHVAMEVTDPNGDPNAGAVLLIGLIQDSGYWRVMGLTFSPKQRTLAAGPTLEPMESYAHADGITLHLSQTGTRAQPAQRLAQTPTRETHLLHRRLRQRQE